MNRRTDHHEQPLFDLGLQLERTTLSWQRMSLSLVVASLVIARLVTPELSVATLAFAFAGLAFAATLIELGHRRYRSNHRKLMAAENSHIALSSAWLPMALAVFVTAVGIVAVVYVIVRSFLLVAL